MAPAATTTTTLAPASGRTAPISGALLKIRDGDPANRSLLAVSRDRTVAPAHDPNGALDPTRSGASLRVWSETGDGFDGSYDLPATGWKPIGRAGSSRGFRYADKPGAVGPVRTVVVKDGVLLKIVARGPLDVSLASAPDPIRVGLTIGDLTYCASFGGTVRFTTGRSYVARTAPVAPCP